MTHQVIEWRVSPGLTDYQAAVAAMESRVAGITDGTAGELVWLLEHPPVYTGGTSAVATDLVDPRFPVVPTGRGGKFTYHGPGQRIGYVMLDLRKRRRDVRCYVHALEGWVIAALGELGVVARRAPGRVGIWVDTERGEEKVGAIGVRVRRWVTLHGFSVNIAPDLSHFGGIVPCGLPDHGVTSLAALGVPATMADFDAALLRTLPEFEDKVGCKQFA